MTPSIIKANGSKVNIMPRNNTDFQLEELREIVGGHIEIVRLSNSQIMVVNEEGKLNGLPFNYMATLCCRMAGVNETIVGDVLVCSTDNVK